MTSHPSYPGPGGICIEVVENAKEFEEKAFNFRFSSNHYLQEMGLEDDGVLQYGTFNVIDSYAGREDLSPT